MKYIDFHFALALIAIFATAGSLYLELKEANSEFDILDASMYSVIQSQSFDNRESSTLINQLDQLEESLNDLKL